ncbi:MAG TPA: helix-turn-helix transcriptional regulator [Rhizobiaceae bacterium]
MAGGDSDRAIASIYAALVGEGSWQDVVDGIAELAQAEMATLFYHDVVSGSGAATLVSGISEAIQRDYSAHFAPLNPWLWRIEAAPVGEAIVGERIVARDSFRRSEYYNDFLRPNGQESGIGVTLRRDESCFFLFSLLTGDTDEQRNEERARSLTRIAPHLRRVSDFYRRQGALGAATSFAEGIGEAAGLAVVVLNAAAQVMYASPYAAALLASGDPLHVGPTGRASFRDPLAQSLLEHSLQGRDLLTRTISRGGVEVTLVRVPEDHGSAIFMAGTVAVLMSRRAMPSGAAAVAARYGLTPAELRVLEGIVAGRAPAEVALANGVSRETVRSQLKAIYAKTGANSQAGLVRLAAGLADGGGGVHAAPLRS